MNQNVIAPGTLAELSSVVLARRIAELLGDERRSLVAFLWHLAEIERRQLHLELGYPSVFAYCTDALHLPKASAFRRTAAARLIRRFPVAAEYLADGRLCLTTLVELRDVLTPENHRELLERAAWKTEDEVKVIVRSLDPLPLLADSIRRVPARAPAAVHPAPSCPPAEDRSPPPTALASGSGPEPSVGTSVPAAPPSPPPAPAPAPRRPRIEPLDGEHYSVRFTVTREFVTRLEQVKSALSHVVPDGDMQDVLLVCFEKTLEACARRKHAALKPLRARNEGNVPSPTVSSGPEPTSSCDAPARDVGSGPEPTSSACPEAPQREGRRARRKMHGPHAWGRSPAAAVKRAAWARDGGRCSYIGRDGKRCNSTCRLEFDHHRPYAWGGAPTLDNIFVRCRAHNQYRARQHFGERHLSKFRRAGRPPE